MAARRLLPFLAWVLVLASSPQQHVSAARIQAARPAKLVINGDVGGVQATAKVSAIAPYALTQPGEQPLSVPEGVCRSCVDDATDVLNLLLDAIASGELKGKSPRP